MRSQTFRCIGLVLAIVLMGVLPAAAVEVGGKQGERILLEKGGSTVIKTDWPVTRVSIGNPAIADVQLLSEKEILIVGNASGSTELVVWNNSGETWRAMIQVQVDLVAMQQHLREIFPSSSLVLSQANNVIVVKGQLRTVDDAKMLDEVLKKLLGDPEGQRYVNLASVAGAQQVLIRVRVAEASRAALRALSIRAVYTNDDFYGGQTIGGNPNNFNIGVPAGTAAGSNLDFFFNSATSVGTATTLFGGFPAIDMQMFIEALVDNQYMRVLAEPSLVVMNGEEASFLAGGEFPVPVAQGGGATGAISVEYREFGVRLSFKPVVLGDGLIQLQVAPEVSDLSDVGAVTLNGFSIPAIRTRRAETTLQMHNGQTFALAGLLNRTTTAQVQKVPGLGDLPIVGSLFRSVRYERGETELVFIATVSLVEPLSIVNGRPVPGDLHIEPNDWELYFMGRIEGGTPDALSPSQHATMKELGLDQLRGPGAWERHGQGDAPSRGVAEPPVSPKQEMPDTRSGLDK